MAGAACARSATLTILGGGFEEMMVKMHLNAMFITFTKQNSVLWGSDLASCLHLLLLFSGKYAFLICHASWTMRRLFFFTIFLGTVLKFMLQIFAIINGYFSHEFWKKSATRFSENEGGGQRLFGTFPKIHPFWQGQTSLCISRRSAT